SDCGVANPVCNVPNGHCVQCVVTADCPAGQACSDHECHPGACTSDATCGGDTPHCNAQSGQCVEGTVDANCKDPQQAHCSPGGHCVECTASTQCANGMQCHDFQCGG